VYLSTQFTSDISDSCDHISIEQR